MPPVTILKAHLHEFFSTSPERGRYSRSVAHVLNTIPTWVVMVVVAILILLVSELGFRVGTGIRTTDAGEGPSSVVQAATFTLVGLLLAFSFSLALQRYDSRRTVLVNETNAIGTTYLRTGLLSPSAARLMRARLRAYVADRLEFVREEDNPSRQHVAANTSAGLQRTMWSLAMGESRRDPRSTQTPLFVATLNQMIDLSTEESAVLAAHIPDIVMIGLVLIVLVASAMMGFGFGRRRQRAMIPTILYVLTLAISIGLVLDLDRPQRGLIRVNLEPMMVLQQEIDRRVARP